MSHSTGQLCLFLTPNYFIKKPIHLTFVIKSVDTLHKLYLIKRKRPTIQKMIIVNINVGRCKAEIFLQWRWPIISRRSYIVIVDTITGLLPHTEMNAEFIKTIRRKHYWVSEILTVRETWIPITCGETKTHLCHEVEFWFGSKRLILTCSI